MEFTFNPKAGRQNATEEPMISPGLAFIFLLLTCFAIPVSAQGTRLLRHPTVSRRHRADLAYLIATVGGELAVGHSYLTGPVTCRVKIQ